MLMAQRNGFARLDMAVRPGSRSTSPPVVVGPGQAVTGVTVKLAPHSVVTGRVVDEDGEVLAGVHIQLQRERWHRGQRQFLPMSGGTTNDLGEYRIAGLTAGRYYVSASSPRRFEGRPLGRIRPASDTAETGYTMTYYPNVADPGQATPIEIAPGQEARGIDFQMRKVVTHRVRGRVTDAAGGPINNVSIMAMPADSVGGPPRFGGGVHNPDGSFELSGVPPGTYTLVVNRASRDGARATAMQQIQVGNRDLEGVVMTLAPPLDIAGVVRMEADGKADLSRLRVSLEPTIGMAGGANQTVKPDGAFTLAGVSPGKYRTAVYNLPEGTYLKSVRQGSQEVLDAGLQIAGATVPLEIVLGSNAPSVTGTVNDSNGKPVPGLAVALVPDAPRRDQYQLYLTGATGDAGTFSFRNITPGNYKVFVLPSVNAEAVQNPNYLTQNESRGNSVRLAEGKTENLQLTFSQ
jgi:hypothetical protein